MGEPAMSEKRTIVITARKKDERAYGVQKYDNNESWNVEGGAAPNGVSATRYLRKTTPDVSLLTPFAAWLVKNVPAYCGGKMPHFDYKSRVRVYNGKTVAEQNNWDEKQKKIWHPMGDQPQKIDDWLFDIIEPNETDERYWNRQAEKMVAVGAVSVSVGDNSYLVQQG